MKKPNTFKTEQISNISTAIKDKLYTTNNLSKIDKIYDVLVNVLPELIVDTIIEYDKSINE
mgnify:FL=1